MRLVKLSTCLISASFHPEVNPCVCVSGLYFNRKRETWLKRESAGIALPVINIQRASFMNSLGPVACMQHSVLWLRADYKHWPRLVYRQRRMVTLLMLRRLTREHASHLVYNESSSVKSRLSLWTCSVLFQLMSTAGPLARCSEFNERNDLGGSWFLVFSTFLCTTEKTGHSAYEGNWWLMSALWDMVLCIWHKYCESNWQLGIVRESNVQASQDCF